MQEAQGQPLPSGRHLLTVPVEKGEEGALRPLPFDERQHSLLCEELKHLYTAITRAKNNGETTYHALLCQCYQRSLSPCTSCVPGLSRSALPSAAMIEC